MPDSVSSTHRHVVIAGGGVAAVEALLALADLGEERLALTVLAPQEDFVLRAQMLGQPWGRPPLHVKLERLCAEHGARLHRSSLQEVRTADRLLVDGHGEAIAYDALVVAVGARPTLAHVGGRSVGFGPLPRSVSGGSGTLAVVVPDGTGWPLPAYELALLAASTRPGPVTVHTFERSPLELFGPGAAPAVEKLLEAHGITVERGWSVPPDADVGDLADEVIVLPRLAGPAVPGLPSDPEGFIRVDEAMRVPGAPGVHAAGDATVGPVKQGGLAAQQAEVVARDIAHATGGRLEPLAYAPVARGVLSEPGGTRLFLRRALTDPDDPGRASVDPLWQPETAVVAMRLMRWLASRPGEFGAPPGPVADHPAEGERTLDSGRAVHLRVAHSRDEELLLELLLRLSPEDLWLRLFSGAVSLPRLARMAADEDGGGVWGLLAVDDEDRPIGHAMLAQDARPNTAEIAFEVIAERRGEGMEGVLLEALADEARRRGLRDMTVAVQPENRRMLDILTGAFFCTEHQDDGATVVTMPLDAVRPGGSLDRAAAGASGSGDDA